MLATTAILSTYFNSHQKHLAAYLLLSILQLKVFLPASALRSRCFFLRPYSASLYLQSSPAALHQRLVAVVHQTSRYVLLRVQKLILLDPWAQLGMTCSAVSSISSVNMESPTPRLCQLALVAQLEENKLSAASIVILRLNVTDISPGSNVADCLLVAGFDIPMCWVRLLLPCTRRSV